MTKRKRVRNDKKRRGTGRQQNPVFANILNDSAKIVFSRTLAKTEWKNMKLIREIDKVQIQEWKQQPGKNMLIFGSGTIVQQLASLGLIEEFQLIFNPLLLGIGKLLFKVSGRVNLKLFNSHAFHDGNVLLQYQPE